MGTCAVSREGWRVALPHLDTGAARFIVQQLRRAELDVVTTAKAKGDQVRGAAVGLAEEEGV
jgi:hypothetical protein